MTLPRTVADVLSQHVVFEIESIDVDREPYLVGNVRYLDEDDGTDAAPLADRAASAFEDYLTGILATSSDPRTDTPLADIRESVCQPRPEGTG